MNNLQKGICHQAYIPIRKDPYERSEMVTQVLFGEQVQILDDEGKWLYIKLLLDGYEGWIDKKCIEYNDTEVIPEFIVTSNTIKLSRMDTGQPVSVAIGASLPNISDGLFTLGDTRYQINDMAGTMVPGQPFDLDKVIPDLLSLPYLWGGRSGFGFDCSGLVQYLGRLAGIVLPRDARDQSSMGDILSFMNETEPGDLAFFDDVEGMIHHVGMLLGNGKIVHASGKVRIDRIDQQGIFNEELHAYTHKLRVMKRPGRKSRIK